MSPVEKLNRLEQHVQVGTTNDKLIIRNDKTSVIEKMSYKEVTSPEFTSFKPLQDPKSPESTPSPDEMALGKRPDLLSRVCKLLYHHREIILDDIVTIKRIVTDVSVFIL